jgi:S1-C subfamily serine protease/Tfp pilus assembly protein PilF
MGKAWIMGGGVGALMLGGALYATYFAGTRLGLPAAGMATPASYASAVAAMPTTAPAALAIGTQLAPDALFTAASPGVARIHVSNFLSGSLKQGSGFVVSAEGLVVTNYHVVEGGTFATVTTSDGTKLVVQGVVAVNPKADLALLKVDAAGHSLTVLRLAQGTTPAIGTHVFAIGNPLGLTNTLSDGLVSGMRTLDQNYVNVELIQTSAPISPGSSGGPLMLADGQVIGVTVAGMDNGQNLNFAVPAAHVRKLIDASGEPQPVAVAAPTRSREAVTDGAPTSPPSARNPQSLSPLEAAALMADHHRYSDAMQLLRALDSSHQKVPHYWSLLGRVQQEGFKNYDVAEDAYRRAIKLKPDYKYPYERLGQLLADRGRFDEALDVYRTEAKVDPTTSAPYRSASLVATKMGHFQQALTLIDMAIQRAPESSELQIPELHMLRGQALFALKRDAESMAEFQVVLKTHPDSSTALSGVGDVQLRSGRTAEAKATFRRILALYPVNQHAHLQLGRIARSEGAMRTAVDEWEKAIAYNHITPDGLAASRERASVSRSALVQSRK